MRVFIDTNLWAWRFDHREPEHYTQAALQALTGFEVVPVETSLILDAHIIAATSAASSFTIPSRPHPNPLE